MCLDSYRFFFPAGISTPSSNDDRRDGIILRRVCSVLYTVLGDAGEACAVSQPHVSVVAGVASSQWGARQRAHACWGVCASTISDFVHGNGSEQLWPRDFSGAMRKASCFVRVVCCT